MTRILVSILAAVIPLVCGTLSANAEHEGRIQILLLGDSTTEGSIPRIMKPQGPHLETVIEQLLAAEGDVPPTHVIQSGVSGEYIRRLIDSGRYGKAASKLPGLDYIFVRYGINDRARLNDFEREFPAHYHELIALLRRDHPDALIIPTTNIPFSGEEATTLMNRLVRQVAEREHLEVFNLHARYAAELTKGPNMFNYRRYPLEKVPEKYHELVKPFVHGPSVLVMSNELDGILGELPGWFGDRHPNLAGYNVIADETAKYLARVIRSRSSTD
jgi:lysophospholipase L1-like esterase